jgi:hypothetical protein
LTGGGINQVVNAAVGFPAALEAVLRRDVAVASIEPLREILTFSDVPKFVGNSDRVHATPTQIVGDPEFTEWSRPVSVERQALLI